MKITSGVAIRLGVLALVVSVGGWLVKNNWWPQGSDNMFVVTDGTPIQAVIVCADSGETLWRLVSVGGHGPEPKSIPYGEVPPGFRQDVPHEGAPRDFVKGEYLQVHILSKTRDMGDMGKATGPREFLTLVNFGRSSPERADLLDCRREQFWR